MTPPAEVSALARRARLIHTERADGASISWRAWDVVGPVLGDGLSSQPTTIDTVVLIHGSYGSWTHWLRNIDALSERLRVVAVDVPGFGGSDPQPTDAAPPSIGRHLAAGWRQIVASERLMSPTRGGRTFLAGFSLGAVYAGWMARAMIEASPPPLAPAGLILLAPGGLGRRLGDMPAVERIPPHLQQSTRRDARLALHRRNLASMMFADPTQIDDTAVVVQDDNVAAARFRGPFSDRPDLLLQALRGLSVPVLGIWGQRDALDPDAGVRADALRSVSPAAGVVVVPKAGHWVGYEASDVVNRYLCAWIRDHAST